jgi:hypothetical protein
MKALPWLYLALLSLGYGLALSYGQLGWLALISVGLLLFAAFAVRQQQVPVALARPWPVHCFGRGAGAALAAGFCQWPRDQPATFY